MVRIKEDNNKNNNIMVINLELFSTCGAYQETRPAPPPCGMQTSGVRPGKQSEGYVGEYIYHHTMHGPTNQINCKEHWPTRVNPIYTWFKLIIYGKSQSNIHVV